ncbi:hypothetical protein CYY_001315 [Polysphondylium violaceum]|uniref:Nuclear envelope membrane protein n=1 Tax=Polysphondylium violaceum TaxID=133409 RepID=A0A8J4V822_9MYCE|nr:hypothetical protein CYY_001315 [Polysphondylium violaceum]
MNTVIKKLICMPIQLILCLVIASQILGSIYHFSRFFSKEVINTVDYNSINENNNSSSGSSGNSGSHSIMLFAFERPLLDEQLGEILNSLARNLIVLFVVSCTHSIFKAIGSSWVNDKALYKLFYLSLISILIESIPWFWIPLNNYILWDLGVGFQLISYYTKLLCLGTMTIEIFFDWKIFEFLGIRQIINNTLPLHQQKLASLKKRANPYRWMITKDTYILFALLLLWFSSSKMTLDLFAICIYFTLFQFTPSLFKQFDSFIPFKNQ